MGTVIINLCQHMDWAIFYNFKYIENVYKEKYVNKIFSVICNAKTSFIENEPTFKIRPFWCICFSVFNLKIHCIEFR